MQRKTQRRRNRSASNSEVDRELDAQPEPSQAHQAKQASGEARWACHNNNTCHANKQSRPSAALEAVLAAYPGLHARLDAVPRYVHNANTVDDVGAKLETSFANSLTVLFPRRLEQAVALALAHTSTSAALGLLYMRMRVGSSSRIGKRLRRCGNEPTSPPYLEGNATARELVDNDKTASAKGFKHARPSTGAKQLETEASGRGA
ncbi:hypothetical protein QJQ45_001993 [Haematococcus lacustris]|nr:hypothetical protein QJQ45_001993 [Haematococcus lacustris]